MTRSAMVFSHPNHEIAVLGTIQRQRPHLIFLTDGGSQTRVDHTRRGLASIGAAADATFLNAQENDLYAALLNGDTARFAALSRAVAAVLDGLDVDAVYCDSAEFYNPLHDIALPVVLAALANRPRCPLYEVPLIHQRETAGEIYEVQRAPEALAAERVSTILGADELAAKTRAFANAYPALAAQLGEENVALGLKRAGEEQFLHARHTLPLPAQDQAMRYDRRGRLLKESGAVAEAITFRDHYVPLFRTLCPGLAA
ncbi:MAG TPA: hypothetical protein VF449_09665 [Parvibaculum sp.]